MGRSCMVGGSFVGYCGASCSVSNGALPVLGYNLELASAVSVPGMIFVGYGTVGSDAEFALDPAETDES